MSDENRKITITVDALTEKRLKAAAATCDVSVERICEDVIQQESSKLGFEEGHFFSGFTKKKTIAEIIAACDAITGGVPLGGPDSDELIREAREERMQAMERASKGYYDCD